MTETVQIADQTASEPIVAAAIGNIMVLQDPNPPGNLLCYRDDGSGESKVIGVFFGGEEGVILATLFAARIAELIPAGPITIDALDEDARRRIIVPDGALAH